MPLEKAQEFAASIKGSGILAQCRAYTETSALSGAGCGELLEALATMAVEVQGNKIEREYPEYSAGEDGSYMSLDDMMNQKRKKHQHHDHKHKTEGSEGSKESTGEDGKKAKDAAPGCTCAVS